MKSHLVSLKTQGLLSKQLIIQYPDRLKKIRTNLHSMTMIYQFSILPFKHKIQCA